MNQVPGNPGQRVQPLQQRRVQEPVVAPVVRHQRRTAPRTPDRTTGIRAPNPSPTHLSRWRCACPPRHPTPGTRRPAPPGPGRRPAARRRPRCAPHPAGTRCPVRVRGCAASHASGYSADPSVIQSTSTARPSWTTSNRPPSTRPGCSVAQGQRQRRPPRHPVQHPRPTPRCARNARRRRSAAPSCWTPDRAPARAPAAPTVRRPAAQPTSGSAPDRARGRNHGVRDPTGTPRRCRARATRRGCPTPPRTATCPRVAAPDAACVAGVSRYMAVTLGDRGRISGRRAGSCRDRAPPMGMGPTGRTTPMPRINADDLMKALS